MRYGGPDNVMKGSGVLGKGKEILKLLDRPRKIELKLSMQWLIICTTVQ